MSDDYISLSDSNSLSDSVLGFRQEQGDRSWQPFGKRIFGHKIFVRRAFAIFATNLSFLRIIANLQILFSMICNLYHLRVHSLPKKTQKYTLFAKSLPKSKKIAYVKT